jgi:hypothetical protein
MWVDSLLYSSTEGSYIRESNVDTKNSTNIRKKIQNPF